MKRLMDRSREVGWSRQTAQCGLSKHAAADGAFVRERGDCIAKLYAARS